MQLSKIIKHLQAQLDQQEVEGDQLREDLAAACEEIQQMQSAVAGHPEALDQVFVLPNTNVLTLFETKLVGIRACRASPFCIRCAFSACACARTAGQSQCSWLQALVAAKPPPIPAIQVSYIAGLRFWHDSTVQARGQRGGLGS